MISQLSPEWAEMLMRIGGPYMVISGGLLWIIWTIQNTRIKDVQTTLEKQITALEKRADTCEQDRSSLRDMIIKRLSARMDEETEFIRESRSENRRKQ